MKRRARRDSGRHRAGTSPNKGSARDRARPDPSTFPLWLVAALGLLTALMWQVCFAPFDLGFLAYVVLVPWGVAMVRAGRDRTAMVWGWLTGLAVFAVGLYWLTWITLVGYAALVLYLGVYLLVPAWFVRQARRRHQPAWLALPIVWVALEYARAYLLSGLPWFFLAHSQYRYTALIQITDVTGQYGVSFFVAMVNGLLIDLIAGRPGKIDEVKRGFFRRLWMRAPRGIVTVAVVFVGLGLYGTFRLFQAKGSTSPGPRVGVVQCAFPVSLSHEKASEAKIFNDHLAQTERLPLQELDLVVWPETVLPTHFDISWKDIDLHRILEQDRERVRWLQESQGRLAELLSASDLPLLAGGMTVRSPAPGEASELFNSAMLITASGQNRLAFGDTYDKMHCVPFGEYVPFRQSWPWLHQVLRKFVPTQMPQLMPGQRVRRFRIGDGRWGLATPICYEGTFARVCRAICYAEGTKKVDCLVNLSNDGWFVLQLPKRAHASSELDQHLAAYVFRAIENRVPVVRAVNCGISGFIDSSGRIEALARDEETGRVKMVSTTISRQVLVDSRHSVYSSVGDLAALLCTGVAGVWALSLWWGNRRRNRQE